MHESENSKWSRSVVSDMDCSLPSSSAHGILQARVLEWVAISFSNAWKWKVKMKSLSHAWLLATPWTGAYQAPPPMGFSWQVYWNGVPLPSPMTKLDSILKSRDITLPTKVRLVKAMVFPSSHVWMWELDHKESCAEELMVLNCGVRGDSWDYHGLKGDPTSPS